MRQKMMFDWLPARKSRARIEKRLDELEAKIGVVGLESLAQANRIIDILKGVDARAYADRALAVSDKNTRYLKVEQKKVRLAWAAKQRREALEEAKHVQKAKQRHDKALSHQVTQDSEQNAKDAKTREFLPIRPRNGYRLIPNGVFRYLAQLEQAIVTNDEAHVRGLQRRLAVSGYEVPTTLSEIAEIRERLKESVNIR